MTDSIISLRISKEMLEKMRANNEINWSAFLRNCLSKEFEKNDIVDRKKMKKAEEIMKRMRKVSRTKEGGKTTTEIIRS